MNESRFALNQRTLETSGAAAGTTGAYAIPIGYACKLVHGWWSHDNAAARTGYWVLTRGGTDYVLHEPAALNANTRRQFYTDVITGGEALILRYGDTLTLTVTLACDAGKKITICLTLEEVIGETA